MSGKNNTHLGKVYNYDGYAGLIISENYNYPFTVSNVNYSEIKNGDLVTFSINTILFGDETLYKAVNISKYTNLNKKNN